MERTILGELRGKTVLLVTNNLDYAKHSNYIYLMDQGDFVLEGKLEDILNSDIYKKFLEFHEVILPNNFFSGLRLNLRKRGVCWTRIHRRLMK